MHHLRVASLDDLRRDRERRLAAGEASGGVYRPRLASAAEARAWLESGPVRELLAAVGAAYVAREHAVAAHRARCVPVRACRGGRRRGLARGVRVRGCRGDPSPPSSSGSRPADRVAAVAAGILVSVAAGAWLALDAGAGT